MSIHEHLPRPIRHDLKQLGWSKAIELVKVARQDGQHFESPTWLYKAQSLPKEQCKERDGWRCQACGSLRGLEVHHIQRRSRLGDDVEANLITLCSDCHRAIHM